MISEIQVLPSPAGTADDRYAHVHAAIEVIQASGLHYEVGVFGTTVEGPADGEQDLLARHGGVGHRSPCRRGTGPGHSGGRSSVRVRRARSLGRQV